jgi:hypothetical protein
MMGKYVSESFKEVHRHNWKQDNPTTGDILLRLVEEYKTPARWNKAIQHLKENGTLLNDPADIGPLMKEINEDILKECRDEIKEKLFEYAWRHISRNLTRGFPEFYKQKLLESQFGVEPKMEQRIEEAKTKSERKCFVCGSGYELNKGICINGHGFYDETNLIYKILNNPDEQEKSKNESN